MVEIEVQGPRPRRSRSPPTRASKRWASTSRTCCPNLFGQQTAQAQDARGRSARLPGAGRGAEAHRHGPGDARGAGARGNERHHLPRRDRQDRRARSRPRPGRQPRRRAARHSAHRRRHHGQYALRLRAHRSHPVHRRRRVPRLQAQRPDPRAAGPLSHPRGAEIAHRGGFHPHPARSPRTRWPSSTPR